MWSSMQHPKTGKQVKALGNRCIYIYLIEKDFVAGFDVVELLPFSTLTAIVFSYGEKIIYNRSAPALEAVVLKTVSVSKLAFFCKTKDESPTSFTLE